MDVIVSTVLARFKACLTERKTLSVKDWGIQLTVLLANRTNAFHAAWTEEAFTLTTKAIIIAFGIEALAAIATKGEICIALTLTSSSSPWHIVLLCFELESWQIILFRQIKVGVLESAYFLMRYVIYVLVCDEGN